MAIITRIQALKLIRAGKAIANGYTVTGSRIPEYVIVDRLDTKTVDHYPVAKADASLLRRLQA